MRILYTLFAILVVRVGICGGNNGAKEALKGAEKQNPPKPTHPASSLTSKADGSLFDLEEGEEGGFKVLKLTPKTGKVTELKYDGKDVWSGKATLGKSSNLVEALIYFDENAPALAIISTDKNSKVYRYHDGKQWKDSKEEEHKKLLDALKKKYQPIESQKPGVMEDPKTLDLATPNSSSYRSFGTNINGVPARVYVVTSGVDITKVKHGDKVVWSAKNGESCFYCALLLRENAPTMTLIRIKGQKLSQVLVENDGSQWKLSSGNVQNRIETLKQGSVQVQKLSLDLSLVKDNEHCRIITSEVNGLKTRIYTLTSGRAIERITDDNVHIYNLNDGSIGYFCEYHSKDNVILLRVHTQKDYNLAMLSYKKEGDKWRSISGRDFSDKLVQMRK
ncbi:hypothetical protein BEWA_002050 [Theileria equi strain WA]|uniref:Signal peptide containing protein n=1 Tax=Theileria equi strain WA TaxID=1537102 RepID=L0AZW0_THEEQ|nr:hypothetical protein BEWA_002050 [Theileria equi strain WA]AFZ80798.1 hypothetical protein BEWA_002050 [Theileria equi strain WA]|eukprot:XP_004830464.1 hypothetical protein BEWA_002050 [Theileria equi strain WA]